MNPRKPDVAVGIHTGFIGVVQLFLGTVAKIIDPCVPACGRVELIPAKKRCEYPDIVLLVPEKTPTEVRTDARGICRFMVPYPEPCAVVSLQSIVRGKPHETSLVLLDAHDIVAGQAIMFSQMLVDICRLLRGGGNIPAQDNQE